MKFEEGTLVKGAYTVVGGVEYEVHMPEYSGNTPLTPENLNKMQEDLLKGEVWYDNKDGTSETINFKNDVFKYKLMRIDYRIDYGTQDTQYASEIIPLVTPGQKCNLNNNYLGSIYYYNYAVQLTITNNKIEFYGNRVLTQNSTTFKIESTPAIKLTRIEMCLPTKTEELPEISTEEERVIELVKQEYGTDQGVSFNIANKMGNIYNVSVVDNNTSAVLKWYTVDMNNETVTES